MTKLDYLAFDADHHYYEAEDAFTRYIDPAYKHRAVQWAEINGKKRLLVGGKINRFIPNPTFDPVAKPGCLDDYFRGRNPDNKSIREIFGDLQPLPIEYRDRTARLAQLDAQGIEACMMFPTLGVGMEEALKDDIPAMLAAFKAFNRWLDEDWGFAHENRLFSAPYFVLSDLEWALQELDWVLSKGAKVIVMRAAPVLEATGTRSPADSRFDPFWAEVSRAGIAVAYHSGDSGYLPYLSQWGSDEEFRAFDFNPKNLCMSATPIQDLCAALVCDGLFDRFPTLRVATIESGSSWVPALIQKMKKAYGQMPMLFNTDPVKSFREHVWVSPYYEDDITELKRLIGADRILFGSDFPHAEGLAQPMAFVEDLEGLSAGDIRLIMRENGYEFVAPSA